MRHFGILIGTKLQSSRNIFRQMWRRSPLEILTLFIFLAGAGTGLYFLFLKSFQFFQGQKPFGPILIDESFYLFNLMLFVMLLLSSSISAYASLFRSREVSFLLTQNIRWIDIYFTKLTEALVTSSWPLLFLILPFTAAFSMTRAGATPYFPFLSFVFYIPFVLLTSMIGTFLAVVCVWLFPGPKSRRLFGGILLASVTYLLWKTQPEIIREQGSLGGILSGYLPHVAFAKNIFLPSCWLTRGILALCQLGHNNGALGADGFFYYQMILANTLFFFLPTIFCAEKLFPSTYLRSQDFGSASPALRFGGGRGLDSGLNALKLFWKPSWGFLEKDLLTFRREPSGWSQLIIFFGLLFVYFLNLRNFQAHLLQAMWKNVIFLLNTAGTYVVLSSFSMRLIFPMISMEGSRAWMIALAPVPMKTVVTEKFWLGTLVSILLTIPLILLSGSMLEIESSKILFTAGLGVFVCAALTGLSVGFGALFPNFKSNNPAEIIAGAGGSLLIFAHLIFLTAILAGLVLTKSEGWLAFAGLAAGSFLTCVIPLSLGSRSLTRREF